MMATKTLRNTFFGIVGFLLILYPVLSFDYGISGDEIWHVKQAKRIVNFYLTWGEDKSSIYDALMDKNDHLDIPNIALYGNSPDTVAYIIQQTVAPGVNIYFIRHFLNAIIGVIGIFFTALLARELGGWRAGLFALAIFIVSPRFMGHTMNNLKDAPFAVAYIVSIYAIIRFLRALPRPGWKFIVLLIASLAFALSIRVGAFLLFIYFLMFLSLHYVNENGYRGFSTKSGKQYIKRIGVMAVLICVAGYFAGLILWPYGLIDPLQNPINALTRQSDFATTIPQVFGGQRIMSNNQPWYYLPKYILITNPLVLFGGLVSLLALLYPFWQKLTNKLRIGFVAFTAVFPLAYIIYTDANVYNAWRHVLFVYPPLVVLGGMGWELLYRFAASRKILQYAVLGVFILLFAYPFQWMIRNHPNQVVYYNVAFGGVEQAYGNYELDYYMNGVKQALEWMHSNGYFTGEKGKDLVVAGNPGTLPHYSDMYETDNTDITYMKYRNRSKEKWDYAIFYTGFVDPYQLREGIWPPEKTIYEVTVEGLPIMAVVKRPSLADFKGYQAFQRKNYQKAISNFKTYLQQDPQNEIVLNLLGNIYMQKKEFQNAISTFKRMLNVKTNSPGAYFNLGYAYAQTGDTQSAIVYLKQAIEYNPRLKQAYRLLGQIYKQRGNQQRARQYLRKGKQL